MNELKKYRFLYLGRIICLYTKYQFLTKSILFFIIFPIFKIIINGLISSTGRVSISSGDYLNFLFSFQGLGLLIISLFILVLLIGLDINSFIIISALIKEKRIKFKVGYLLFVSIRSIKSIFEPSGILVILYVSIITPLVGIGLSISVMKDFKIPNFITQVIFTNNLYFTMYSLVIIFFTVISIVFIFFFHYLIVDNRNIKSSLIMSFRLMNKHWKDFIKKFFIKFGFIYIGLVGMVTLLLYILLFYFQNIEFVFFRRLVSIFISISIVEILGYVGLMTTPLICYVLTDLFYEFNEQDGNEIVLKKGIKAENIGEDIFKKVKFRTKFFVILSLIIVLFFNFILSLFFSIFFEDIFKSYKDIFIVAHRGGGDLAAENSIKGMEEAVKYGAKWSEIDVQRTKDGKYIINHDSTFFRVGNNNKRSIDLTLNEIKDLRIKDLFDSNRPSQEVPILEEYLDAAKGKIGLFIELKGISADNQMVDDVVKMVKERGMEKEVAILSLDYQLINYTENKYPEIDTGYLYFFSIGKTKKLTGDILIMEEREATSDKISSIHREGKKAVVWTVNTDESIKKFVSSDVDGIITDHVLKVKNGINERNKRTDIQVIIDSIIE